MKPSPHTKLLYKNDPTGKHFHISFANLTIYHELMVIEKPERDKQCDDQNIVALNRCFSNAQVFGIINEKAQHIICTLGLSFKKRPKVGLHEIC